MTYVEIQSDAFECEDKNTDGLTYTWPVDYFNICYTVVLQVDQTVNRDCNKRGDNNDVTYHTPYF